MGIRKLLFEKCESKHILLETNSLSLLSQKKKKNDLLDWDYKTLNEVSYKRFVISKTGCNESCDAAIISALMSTSLSGDF